MSHVVEAAPSVDEVPVSRLRVIATALATVLVVVAEFLLLSTVYHRADDVREQRVVTAEFRGEVAAHADVDALRHGVARLAGAGVPDGYLTEVRSAVRALDAAPPAEQGRFTALQQASGKLASKLSADRHRLDHEADLAYALLLVVASVGWMFWFRRLVSRHRDLQRQVTEQTARAVSEQRLAALVQNSADIVAVIDADSTIAYVTPSVEAVLGRAPDTLIGKRWLDIVADTDKNELLVQLLASHRDGVDQPITMPARHASGRELYLEGTLTGLLADPAVGGLVLTVRDVTERRELENRLTFQAFHDSLTDLANRQLFADRLEHALVRRAGHPDPTLVVLYFDLDDFKQINDSVGHAVGDVVLTQVGARLAEIVRDCDTAARLGGDEFAVLLENSTLEAGWLLAERLQLSLREPITIEGSAEGFGNASTHVVTASVGLVEVGPDAPSGADIMRNADVAMYLAKGRGRGNVAVYEPQLHAQALERLQLQTDLARALDVGGLVLHYQPCVNLQTNAIVGFEALVRWQHDDRGMLPPDTFIPMAEQTGLIVPLGTWVLHEACRAAVSMQRDGARPSMSVNVAAAQLIRPTFVDEVRSALAESGLPAELLCLEITESGLLGDLDAIVPKLVELRASGITVAIDDFGTGYSSLAYLAKLPVDVLKIDKSFIDRVTLGEQEASVTQAILAMSRAMHLTTVAEGIELSEQADWLIDAQCTIGQGYFWSRPVPFDEARALLAPARPVLLAP